MTLRESLEKLKKKEAFSLHMPGHKGVRLKTDTTELSLTDNLLNPKGGIKELEKAIAHIYDVKRAYLGTNGSTGLIMSSMLHLGDGKKVALPRASHLSVYKGLIANRQVPVYLKNETDSLGIARPVAAREYLLHIKDIDGAVFTSPTYEGYMEDYAVLKPFFKDKTAILDGAHGSHHYYIKNRINEWMNLQVHSFHKTMGAMNQGAVLLSNLEEDIREEATFYQTSSPSFPILLSIEDSIREMMKMKIDKRLEGIKWLRHEIKKIRGFSLVENDDPFKLLMQADKNIKTSQLTNWLREKRGIIFELETDSYILGILGFYDTMANYEWFLKSLKMASRHFKMDDRSEDTTDIIAEQHIPEMRLLPHEAFRAEKRAVSLSESSGLISAVFCNPYPPGSPLLVPGERIDNEVIRRLEKIQGDMTGCSQLKDDIIFVIK